MSDAYLSWRACLAEIRRRWEKDCRTAEPIMDDEAWALFGGRRP